MRVCRGEGVVEVVEAKDARWKLEAVPALVMKSTEVLNPQCI